MDPSLLYICEYFHYVDRTLNKNFCKSGSQALRLCNPYCRLNSFVKSALFLLLRCQLWVAKVCTPLSPRHPLRMISPHYRVRFYGALFQDIDRSCRILLLLLVFVFFFQLRWFFPTSKSQLNTFTWVPRVGRWGAPAVWISDKYSYESLLNISIPNPVLSCINR